MRSFYASLAASAVLALTLVAGIPPAGAATYERAGATPVASSASARASSAVPLATLRARLGKLMRGAGRSSGAWVADLGATGKPVRLFARRAGRSRKLASNTKVFTTSTALVKFTPLARLQTTAWSTGTLLAGALNGNLVLRGGGDPTLTGAGLATLATRVRAAGVTSVSGHLIYDESLFDAVRGVPQTGVSGGLGGELSGLTYPGGARKAAQDFVQDLKDRGVAISSQVQPGALPPITSVQLAAFGSPTMADLIEATNVPSNNFYAETLLKDIGAKFGTAGSTVAGLAVLKPFAAARGATFSGENGSGLSVRNRAAPASVGRLLVSMLREPADVSTAWTDSLAVAGVSGTLVRRMRGTAAAGRCKGKTGTLSGVSVLSGYCFAAGHTVVFSLLMNRVTDARAHLIQDKMVATMARFAP
ncbi:MAG: D-alanyl-D-alanine carboxypeptidase/D-alanyl-D-alanine-endopeptidase [Solirubrobacterales bacterium]